jgi:phosphinothricin acetyltransferase
MSAQISPDIRLAAESDLAAIDDIYNYYVHTSTCTYQEIPGTMDERRAWFSRRERDWHPVTVAEIEGEVVGWGALNEFRPRTAYRFTVEDSVYVRHDLHRRGIGRALLADLIERSRAIGHRSIVAGIDGEQGPSIRIHEAFGFVRVAHLKQVGFKFGRWLDVIYLQLMLGDEMR